MKNQKQTIRKIVGFLNNADEEGGFWLPNIQRPFVWREEQICRLIRFCESIPLARYSSGKRPVRSDGESSLTTGGIRSGLRIFTYPKTQRKNVSCWTVSSGCRVFSLHCLVATKDV